MWKTERMLYTQHQQTLSILIPHLPNANVARDENEFLAQLKTAVNQYSTTNLWLWVKMNDQSIPIQSSQLSNSPIAADLLDLTEPMPQPRVLYLKHQVIIYCSSPLEQRGKTLGQLYTAEDVTQNYTLLSQLAQSLRISSFAAIALLSLFISWFIRRSLRPLNRLKRATVEQNNLPPMESEAIPTEVRELAQIYNQLHDRLSEANFKQQQFTHSLSHELRTPLSLVYGYLQSMLKHSPNLTESQQEALSIAVIETENTIQLLKTLLENAREDTTARLRLKPVSVNVIAAELIRTVQQFDQRTVQIETSEALIAIADAEALRQVLDRILDNAFRYSAADQAIILRLFQKGDWVVIQVIDQGCGIDPLQQSLIFEPLYRVESSRSRSTGGVGLGLALARSLVEGMGGTISVESKPGKGSTFIVTLQRAMP